MGVSNGGAEILTESKVRVDKADVGVGPRITEQVEISPCKTGCICGPLS